MNIENELIPDPPICWHAMVINFIVFLCKDIWMLELYPGGGWGGGSNTNFMTPQPPPPLGVGEVLGHDMCCSFSAQSFSHETFPG